MRRADILFIVFAGVLGYTLGLLLGLLGIILAMITVFALGKYLNNRESSRSNNLSIGNSIFISKPVNKARLRYRCLSCYHIYTGRRECPKCGSKIKQAEF